MPIRYKVVKHMQGGRFSVTVWRDSRYCLKYPKGVVVEALENTLGIMTFNTFRNAQEFMTWNLSGNHDYSIIKVNGIGRGRKIKLVLWTPVDTDIDELGEKIKKVGWKASLKSWLSGRISPAGTICYKAIEVLE